MGWIDENRLALNLDQTNVMVIGAKAKLKEVNEFNVNAKGTLLKRVYVTKCLGLLIDDELRWTEQVNKIISTIQAKLGMLRRVKPYVPIDSMKMLYNAFVLPHFDYCSQIWSNRFQMHTDKLSKLQKRAARIILSKDYSTPSVELFESLNWMPLQQRFMYLRAVLMYKCMHNLAPHYLSDDIVVTNEIHQYGTRQATSNTLTIPNFRTECLKHSPFFSGIFIWNSLDQSVKSAQSVSCFKSLLKSSILSQRLIIL